MAKFDAAFWRRIVSANQPTRLFGTLLRLVENQEQKVTVKLVDNLAEHELLENLLEASKPLSRTGRELNRLDYLLRTPWRYPPLRWGSRFGQRFEASLFYGSLSHNALFAEAAYYRLVFLDGMQTPFADRVISQHTMFGATYQTDSGVDLGNPPFSQYEKVLRHKADYAPCQALGSELRQVGIDAISYLSARAAGSERNIALVHPRALRSRKHLNPQHGLCETRIDGVTFRFGEALHHFEREAFLDRGQFPQPAF